MPPAKSLSPSVEGPRPKRTMPPAYSVSRWRPRRPLAELASAPGGTTTTGHGARLETSAETLPSKDERGPVEPTTIIAAFSAAAAATSRSAGWPTSTSQPAPQSTSVAPRGNTLESFGDGADLLLGRAVLDDTDEHQPEPELAAQAPGDPGRTLGRLRIVDAADDQTSHRAPPSVDFFDLALKGLGPPSGAQPILAPCRPAWRVPEWARGSIAAPAGGRQAGGRTEKPRGDDEGGQRWMLWQPRPAGARQR